MERAMSMTACLESIESRADSLCRDFASFTDGPRMLILLQREKDGGSHKEDRRNLCSRFTFDANHFKKALIELLLIKTMYPTSRIYSSLNRRDLNKVIRTIEHNLLDIHYCADAEQVAFTQRKLIKSPRHFFMQPRCQAESLFLIDVDNIPEEPYPLEIPLKLIGQLGIEMLHHYKTKNGHHIIVRPFDSSLWTHSSEIKKDALILLDY